MDGQSLDALLAMARDALSQRRLDRILSVASSRLRGLTIAFDSLHDPHNVSAALRSCEAFGTQAVHLVGSTRTVPLNRGITKGCERWLSFHWHASASACVSALRQAGFRVLLAMPAADAAPIEAVDFGERVALVFGNEHAGVSTDFQELADGRFHVPMAGFVKSFNVSVAVAVSLSYAARARREALGAPSDLTAQEHAALLSGWLRRELETRSLWREGDGRRRGGPGQ